MDHQLGSSGGTVFMLGTIASLRLFDDPLSALLL